jgi:hypothetical protein
VSWNQTVTAETSLHQPHPRLPIERPELHEVRNEPLPVQVRVERRAPAVADACKVSTPSYSSVRAPSSSRDRSRHEVVTEPKATSR